MANMLPILLLGAGALFLMSRGDEEEDEDPPMDCGAGGCGGNPCANVNILTHWEKALELLPRLEDGSPLPTERHIIDIGVSHPKGQMGAMLTAAYRFADENPDIELIFFDEPSVTATMPDALRVEMEKDEEDDSPFNVTARSMNPKGEDDRVTYHMVEGLKASSFADALWLTLVTAAEAARAGEWDRGGSKGYCNVTVGSDCRHSPFL